MATTGLNLSALGLNATSMTTGNGIDVTSVVNQILNSERGPEQIWQQQQTDLSAQTGALNSINSGLTALQTAIRNLSDVTGVMSSNAATSSQTGILTASVQAGASSGNHVINVNNLATTATAYTDAVASSDTTFQTGVITLKVGSTSTDITVDNTNNTLTGLVNTINSKNLNVTASVINDSTGARLALVSKTTGSAGDMTVTGNTSGLNFHKSVIGQDASLTIDGVPFSSTTNTVTGGIAGVTLNLVSSAPNTSVQLSVGPNTSAITQAVNNFVSAYNNVMNAVNSQYVVNANANTAGPLASDSSLRSLQSSLLSDVTYAMTGNDGYTGLASLGINMADDGTLSVDSTAFNGALSSHFSDVQSFFQQVGSFGSNFSKDLTGLTDPTAGLVNADLTAIANQQKDLSNSIADFEDRLSARQTQLTNEYSQIDAMLRDFPLQMQAIQAQLNSLTPTTK